jgi:hypothetical protein
MYYKRNLTAGGVEETMNAEWRRANSDWRAATIIRGVLFLDGDCPRTGTVPKTILLDISGRKVADLKPGANDISRLAPGVYFASTVGSGNQTRLVLVR